MPRKTRGLLAVLLLLTSACAGRDHVMAFWIDRGATTAGLPGLVSAEDHPCGAIVELKVAAISHRPVPGRDIQAETIVERAPEGGELRRWSAPVDYQLLAVRGDEILIQAYGREYWIATDGRLRRQRGRLSLPAAETRECRTDDPLAEGSDYAFCSEFSDLATGEPRIVTWEGVCT